MTDEKHQKRYHKADHAAECPTCSGCLPCRETRRAGRCECPPPVTDVEPQPVAAERAEPLRGEALLARKREAGAGRKQEAGTAFGSRWTDKERERLQELYSEHGRSAAVAVFVREHPHRTAQGAVYQIERNLSK